MAITDNRALRSFVRNANRLVATPFNSRDAATRAAGRLGTGSASALRRAVGGRVVLVTGASTGIGRAAAVSLAAAGAKVLVVARSEDLLIELVEEITESGGLAVAYRCDLTDLEAIDDLAAKVLDQHGHVDVLVNNAGMSIRRKVRHSVGRFQDFERPMQLNYFAAVRLTMGLLPTMVERESGQVVNISSWAAIMHPARFSGYAASKAALEAWSDSVQGEVLGDGVVFTDIHMPLVRTPMIAPTKLYSQLPALSMDQAAQVICDAVVSRSRKVTPLAAGMTTLVDSVSRRLGDRIRQAAI
ncbi:MAG TPA: SDR family NAD(P)-dependent oxidoreductase [Marmoricola sp.]|jgi:short-subunit dehydrogenase|nr:SDR family NAD(P)-dependent oxidoreductase [Marmoricola sp.]